MKALLISFLTGRFVGILYGIIRVKSPAPPIIALIGLLGMVLGEQAGGRFHATKAPVASVVSPSASCGGDIIRGGEQRVRP